MATVALVLIGLSICVIKQTKRLPHTLKILTAYMLVLEAMFLLSHLFYEMVPGGVIRDTLGQFRRSFILADWFMVATIALERFYAVVFPFHFVRFSSTALRITMALHVSAIGFRLMHALCSDPNLLSSNSMRLHTNAGIYVVAAVIVGCYLKIAIVYVNTIRKIRNTIVNVAQSENVRPKRFKMFKSTKVLVMISMCFLLFHLPLVIETTVDSRSESEEDSRNDFNRHTSFLLFANSLLMPLLYIWRFDECKLIFLSMLSKFISSDRLEKTAVAMRMRVFEIPVKDSAETNSTPSSQP